MPVEMLEAFRQLREHGLGVLDVGARGGSPPLLRSVAPILNVVGFEPDADEGNRLQEQGSKGSPAFRSLSYLPWGLGETDGQHLLHLCRSPGGSSFYEPNHALLQRFPDADRFDVMTTRLVPVRSLDSLMRDPAVQMPKSIDWIKIDTQGSELDILRGAKQALADQVIAIEVEVEFAQLYESQPMFRDVDAWLAACGFTLFKLRRQEWVRCSYARQPQMSAGQLVFGDALYLKDPLDARRSWMPRDGRQAEALILLAVLYDLHDFARELLSMPQFSTLLDTEQIGRFVRRRSRKLTAFFERLRVVKATLSSTERFRRYPARWARGDDNFYSACR